MGMDVLGRDPSGARGEYFRANVWAWRPIHELIGKLCDDLLDDELHLAMGFNGGDGPEEKAVCAEMARRFEDWLSTFPDDEYVLESDCRVDESGHFVTEKEIAENPSIKHRSAYSIARRHLQQWIGFLKECGGFSVY